MSKSSLRIMMALLRELSHRWLGARPGGPGTQPLVLCLLLLGAAVAAVPTWAIIPPTAGRTCIDVRVSAAYPNSEEAPGDIAGIRWVDDDAKYSCSGGVDVRHLPDNDLVANNSLNQRSFASTTWKQNLSKEVPGDVAGIRWDQLNVDGARVSRTCTGGNSSCNLMSQARLTSTIWKQNHCKEAPGDTAGNRWDCVNITGDFVSLATKCRTVHTYNSPAGGCDTCNGAQKRFAPTKWKRNPLKEASGGAAGIRRVSRCGSDTFDLSALPIFYSDDFMTESAMGANASMSTSTISSTPHQRHDLTRRMICIYPLPRAAVTLSNRKWRLLETS